MEPEVPEQASLNEAQHCLLEGEPIASPTSSHSRASSSKARKIIRKRKPLEICKKNGGISRRIGKNSSSGASSVKGKKTVSASSAGAKKKVGNVDKPTEGFEVSSKPSPDCPSQITGKDSRGIQKRSKSPVKSGEGSNPTKAKRESDENPGSKSSKFGKKMRKVPEEKTPNLQASEGANEIESNVPQSNDLRPWRCGMRKSKRKVSEAEMHQQSPIKQKMCLDPERARKVQEYMENKQRERKRERQRMEAEAKAVLLARQEKTKTLELQRRERLRMDAAQNSRKGSLKRPAWDSDFSQFPNCNIGPWTTQSEADVGFPPPKPHTTEHISSFYGGYEGLEIQEPRNGQVQQRWSTDCQPDWTCANEIHPHSQPQDLSSFPYPKGYVQKIPQCRRSSTPECSTKPEVQKSKPQGRRTVATSLKTPSRASMSKSNPSLQKIQTRTSSSLGKYQRVSPRTLKRVVTTSSFLRSSIEKMRLEKQRQQASTNTLPGGICKAPRINDSQGSHKLGKLTSMRSNSKSHTQVVRASSVRPPQKPVQVNGKVNGRASVKRLGVVGSKKLQVISEEERLKARLSGFLTKNASQMPANNKGSGLLATQSRSQMKNEPIQKDTENCRSNEVKDERILVDVDKKQRTILVKTIAQQLAGHLSAAANIANWKNNALFSPKDSNGVCYDKSSDKPAVSKYGEDDQFRSISVTELRQLLEKKCNATVDPGMSGAPDGIISDEELQRRFGILSSSLHPTQQIQTLNENSPGWKHLKEFSKIHSHDVPSKKIPLPMEGEKLSVINLYLKHQHSKQLGEIALARELEYFGSDGRLKRPSGAQDPWLHSSDNQTFAFPEIQGSCGLLLDSIQCPPNQSDKAFFGKKVLGCRPIPNNGPHIADKIYVEDKRRSGRKLAGKDSLTDQARARLQKGKKMTKKQKKSSRKQNAFQLQMLPENSITTQVSYENQQIRRINEENCLKRICGAEQVKAQPISEDSGYHCSSDSSEGDGQESRLIRKDRLVQYEMRRCRDSHDEQVKWDTNALEEELQRLDKEIVQTKARMERNPLFIHTGLPNDCVPYIATQKHMSPSPRSDCSTNEHLVEKENSTPVSPSSFRQKSLSPCTDSTVHSSGLSEDIQTDATPNLPNRLSPTGVEYDDLVEESSSQLKHNSDSACVALEGPTDGRSNPEPWRHDERWKIQKCGLTGAKFDILKASLRDSSEGFNGTVCEETSQISEVDEELKLNPEVISEPDSVLSTHLQCPQADNFLTSEHSSTQFDSREAGLRDSSEDFHRAVAEETSHAPRVDEELKIAPKVTGEFDNMLATQSTYQEIDKSMTSEHSTDESLREIQGGHQTGIKDGSIPEKTADQRWETEEDISEDIIFNGEEDQSDQSEKKSAQNEEECQPHLIGMLHDHAQNSTLNKLDTELSVPVDNASLVDGPVNCVVETDDFKHITLDLQEAQLECSCEMQGKEVMNSILSNLEEEHDIFSLDTIGVGTGKGQEEMSPKNNAISIDPMQEGQENTDWVKESKQENASSSKETNQESSLNEYLSQRSHIASEHHSLESWFEDSALDLSWAACNSKEDAESHISNKQVNTDFEKEEHAIAADFITDKILENILEDELSDFTSRARPLSAYNSQLKVAVEGPNDSCESSLRNKEESEHEYLPSKMEMPLTHIAQTSATSSKDSESLDNDSSFLSTKFIFTSKSMRKYSSYIFRHFSDRGTPVTDTSDDYSEGDMSQGFVQAYVRKVLGVSGLFKDPSSLIWSNDFRPIPSDVHELVNKCISAVSDEQERNHGRGTQLLFDAVNEFLQKHSLKVSAWALEFTRPLLTGEETVQAVANDIFRSMNLGCKSGLDLELLLEKSLDEEWNNHIRETLDTCSEIAEALLGDLVGGLVNELENDYRTTQLGVCGIEAF